MKRSILFFATLFMINMASAQSYFGYCTAQVGGHTYVSEVVEVNTLPNSNVSTQALYGKRKLAEYYDDVVKQWFYKILNNNGVDAKQSVLYTQLMAGTEDYSNTCKTGYESACLCQNKNAAIEQRKKDLKSDPNTIILSSK